jgi:hypothetical protein
LTLKTGHGRIRWSEIILFPLILWSGCYNEYLFALRWWRRFMGVEFRKVGKLHC